ncbi:hypothetical protein BV20DRAFT_908688, partial [Pilatotrama ljubarskyi]
NLQETIRTKIEVRRAKVRDLLEEITQLSSTLNTFALVSTLPPELLTIIFSYVVAFAESNKDVIALSHVCKHWRSLALDFPPLWAEIKLNRRDGIIAFAERSKRLPL